MDPAAAQARDEARSSWRLTLMACLLMTALLVMIAAFDLTGVIQRSLPPDLRVGQLVLAFLITFLVWRRRFAPTRAFCSWAFAALALPMLVSAWAVETWLAAGGRSGEPWTPFLGPKLMMVVVAALCPRPRWLAPFLIGAFTAEAIVLWFRLDLPDANIPVEEPWPTIVFVAIALTLFGYRVYHEQRERELAKARAEAAMLRTVNEAFVTVQDMANTPLQNLELVLAMLSPRCGEAAERLVAAAHRAVVRLRELGRLVPVSEVTSASIDPATLEEVRKKLSRHLARPEDDIARMRSTNSFSKTPSTRIE